jgi:hypothetical protein
MIINKKTLSIQTRSDKPNENWTNNDCYVIEDGSDLANKIMNNYPNIEYVIENDEIKDVKIVEPEPIEKPVSELEQLRADIDYIALMKGVDL